MDKNNSSGGIGFTGVLLIVFIILKLVGVINWSWLWVLSPLWISLILLIIVVVACAIFVAHEEDKFVKRRKDKWRF